MLQVDNLKVTAGEERIINKISLSLKPAEIQALMGPNGSGKTTLAQTLAGQKLYHASGSVKMDGQELLGLSPEKRARLGLLVGFQNPVAIPGVKVLTFLKHGFDRLQPQKRLLFSQFRDEARVEAKNLGLAEEFLERELNQYFSGGEGKRLEILQAIIFKPKYAIFDEIDSGVDVDGLRLMRKSIERLRKLGTGVVLITHQPRLLKFIKPSKIHLLIGGRIIQSGNSEIIKRLERSGYKSFYCVMCNCPGIICPRHKRQTTHLRQR